MTSIPQYDPLAKLERTTFLEPFRSRKMLGVCRFCTKVVTTSGLLRGLKFMEGEYPDGWGGVWINRIPSQSLLVWKEKGQAHLDCLEKEHKRYCQEYEERVKNIPPGTPGYLHFHNLEAPRLSKSAQELVSYEMPITPVYEETPLIGMDWGEADGRGFCSLVLKTVDGALILDQARVLRSEYKSRLYIGEPSGVDRFQNRVMGNYVEPEKYPCHGKCCTEHTEWRKTVGDQWACKRCGWKPGAWYK